MNVYTAEESYEAVAKPQRKLDGRAASEAAGSLTIAAVGKYPDAGR